MAERLRIDHLGHRGDGVAATPSGPAYVPFTLAGETVEVEGEGDRRRLARLIEAAPERVAPVCPHFGRCGGCAVQHLAPGAYRAWKREMVIEALRQQRIEAEIEAPWVAPLESRRRVMMALARRGKRVLLGYRERLSHAIVDVESCPIARPEIVAAVPHLREALAPLAPDRGAASVAVLATRSGLDVAVSGGKPANGRALLKLTQAFADLPIARLTVAGEVAHLRAEPAIDMDGIAVTPPPGAFVQAVAEAEEVLAGRVVETLAGQHHVADLYCGLGTFALRLAREARVAAYEGDRALLDALSAAARQPGLKPVETTVRDLARDPLSANELKRFDGLVLDPPRAGALAQVQILAKAGPPAIAMVSCNPATFARDARLLLDGGYRMGAVTPVDQFLFAAHIELVASFTR
jgi:23S rRNA (uracil1939-C5)-methyltransferase